MTLSRLIVDHRFVDYPNDPKPDSIYACRSCGHMKTVLEIQAARFNFPCNGCGSNAGFMGYVPQGGH